jgi:Transposase
MSKMIERCAGIDIGKRFLLCSVLTGAAHEDPASQTRRFDTNVPDLQAMCEWLRQEAVTHVVMESTGSYWIPVFNLLEGHFTIVLANPEEVKNRKGHKTDRKDAEHLADLLRHNHVRASYIPPEPVRQLRDLTRRRIQLTQDASRERNRVQKLLEQANVKIASVLSDVFGVSGQNMLLALLGGQATPEETAQLARGTGSAKNTATYPRPRGEPNERSSAVYYSQLPAPPGLFGRGDRRARRGDPPAHGAVCFSECVPSVANDTRHRSTVSRYDFGRNRPRFSRIPNRRKDGQLGWLVPWQQGKRRHPERKGYHARQSLLADDLGAVRVGRRSETGFGLPRPLPATIAASRAETRYSGGRSFDAKRALLYADARRPLSGCAGFSSAATTEAARPSPSPISSPARPHGPHHARSRTA